MYEVQRNDLSTVTMMVHVVETENAWHTKDTCCNHAGTGQFGAPQSENIHQLLFDGVQSELSGPRLLESIVRCCVDSTEPDLRNEAAGVLLSVVEMAIEERGQMLRRVLGPAEEGPTESSPRDINGRANVLSTLQLLSESFDSSLTSALKARAGQCVRELEEMEADCASGRSARK